MTKDYLFIAAIDFGTTYSGWSFISRHDVATDPTKAYIRLWYSGTGTLATEKTPTVVLIKPDGKTLEAFGYEAENTYRQLAEEEESDGFYYFRRFKMMLMKTFGETITRDAVLEDEMGRRLPAVTVFELAIEFLVQDAYSNMAKRARSLFLNDIKWVLTVPAIWTDPAKKFMRQAAQKAGISPDKLVIALEPECASIFCRHVPFMRRLDDTGVNLSSLPVGSKYMLIDAGGGTVDITIHEIEEAGALKELIAASGGGWGGILVDEAFENLLIDLVGAKVYQAFKTNATDDWLHVMREFEIKKREFKGQWVNINVPGTLLEFYLDEYNKNLSESIASSTYGGCVKLQKTKLKCQVSLWKQLYDNSIKKTIEQAKELLAKKEVKHVTAIIMVGGFSESTLLQERIKDSFCLDVIIPTDASSAVLKGALIYGFDPGCIRQRVLQYTYGYQCILPFIEGIHPESKRVVRDSGVECQKCFDKHVEIGQVVKYGEPQTSQYYSPGRKNAKLLLFPLHYSKLHHPIYTDEGCSFLESFTVPLTDPTGDLERRVCVSLTFSGTEIEAEGREENTGKVTKAKFHLPD